MYLSWFYSPESMFHHHLLLLHFVQVNSNFVQQREGGELCRTQSYLASSSTKIIIVI